MNTATYIKNINGRSDGRLYKLNPPLSGDEGDYEYVWVSAAIAPYSGPETYIFGCDRDGAVLSWLELDGSFQGGLDHEQALENAGYIVAAN